MSAFDDLLAFQRQTEALSSVAERLAWDQETVMPRGAVEQRAEEMAAMESVLHERRTDPRLGEWLDQAEPEDDEDARVIELIARDYRRASRIPSRLATELARQTSLAQGIWADARAKDAPEDFLPALNDILMLKREEAAALADGGDLYDALLDDYEPGTTQAEIATLFDAMRPRLVALREDVLGAAFQPQPLTGHFPQETQLRLARTCATAFGYDWTRGRMDIAVHPFSSGRWQDSRITTRVVEADPFNCLYSTIHEVGHSSYELGIDSDYAFTPLGRGVSMGAHESQSRIYENQLGRGRAFTGWLYRRMSDAFGGLSVPDADAFYGTVNRVTPGFIRTEADEVQYNLHIMLRFDLERDLIAGRLDVEDLVEAWNARFLRDFGVAVDRPANGVLQDVHWAVGLFGYFPTYALGNVYAGCLHAALRAAVPDLDEALARGEADPAVEWLRENMQRHGGLYPQRDLIERATGADIGEGPLLDYLEEKFSAIYRL
ncbi:carboxypeptidase M32 [Paracoccus denitrificans]|jgi:carboxypeptidase Taq|uniref:Metal-dependent carboxypeptidase n=1 Tax=Paracoccus denitrificans (strain Pd 1222) TaxID=318586 RepID=A1B8C3_PARDP|nr:carboxypeptidase M32 [Paracoccus denitrificans]ABL71767.1 carboxypeptidase Taq, Metallo peptidase, MEROPS family M32 [Paracoccus denitrificans PD1222]MBB4628136.1 carboxypeptidase Taq [Paracoccus denitrificans]MCU7429201.1 carboxypeptidase M32 [Paracoccus denitrificans]QAR28357.1 carboxypeptidase M32 [Paracoccus denitrificans]UPV98097.1 carboxypeptidase M32 [Paracoccus denitrificans]